MEIILLDFIKKNKWNAFKKLGINSKNACTTKI